MSESPALAWALGSLAGSHAGAETARAVNSFFAGVRERAQPTIDVNALIHALQEQEKYISALQRENGELRAQAEVLQRNRDKIWEWAKRAEEELRRRDGR